MHPTRAELKNFLRQARARPPRTLRAFAEQQIVVPSGPFAGRRYRCARQPYTGLWFDAVDSGRFSRCVAAGPTQSGKTLSCFLIPLLYHLFELQETVICGLPDMEMAADKWREDILPAIESSAYRELLPARGAGSRGGRVEAIQFRHGATLKFMSGGGGDKSRAGFTARVVVVSETDGLDQPGAASRESDKLTQLEARTRAYGSRKRIYLECTVSTEQGRTWHEYLHGTRSRIMLPCPHCRAWVAPEREHLAGWQTADSQAAARVQGHFICPACSVPWSESDRRTANEQARLVHGEQSLDADGHVQGGAPPVETLGFRWSAVHNLFLTAGDLAADEWQAARAVEEEHAERAMRQFVWCLPVASNQEAQTQLEAQALTYRQRPLPQGIVPPTAQVLTAAIDLGKYLAHWVAVAWSESATGHVVDYGRLEVASDHLGVEQALLVMLREFADLVGGGWPIGKTDGQRLKPRQIWIDAGYMTDVVYGFCRQHAAQGFRPAVGRGAAQQHRATYHRPAQTGGQVKHVGEGFHLSYLPAQRLHLAEVDADHWKSWVHQRLSTPLEAAGALAFYQTSPVLHLPLARHLTAEVQVEEFVAGRGVLVRWERLRRQNHWLDALYNACAAAHLCGVRLVSEPRVERRAEPPRRPAFTREDGRPWLDVQEFQERSRRLLGS